MECNYCSKCERKGDLNPPEPDFPNASPRRERGWKCLSVFPGILISRWLGTHWCRWESFDLTSAHYSGPFTAEIDYGTQIKQNSYSAAALSQ